ncbi:MAG: hypothetical protein JSS72_00445 [Armatimonadetes bacterium]|nr:hypothetical protein [Armatimonadota bacterium]
MLDDPAPRIETVKLVMWIFVPLVIGITIAGYIMLGKLFKKPDTRLKPKAHEDDEIGG